MGTENFKMCKLGFKEAEEPRSNCKLSFDHRESKRISEKNLKICFTDFMKGMQLKTTMKY